MTSIEKIKIELKMHKDELRKKYGANEIGIFGSYLKNEQTKDSDLDILVDFENPLGLFKFMELENYLSDFLNVKVDLVMKRALRPNIGKRILDEVIYV